MLILRKRLVHVLEQPSEDGLVVHGPLDIFRPGFGELDGRALEIVFLERIAAVQRKNRRQEHLAEILVQVQLRIRPLEPRAERRHRHDAAGGGRCPRAHLGPVREYLREVLVHPFRQGHLLVPAPSGKVAGAVADFRIETVETRLEVRAEGRQVVTLSRLRESGIQPGVQVTLPGVASAVATVITDIERLVSLRRRGELYRAGRAQVVGAGEILGMGLKLGFIISHLGPEADGGREKARGGKDPFSHELLGFLR